MWSSVDCLHLGILAVLFSRGFFYFSMTSWSADSSWNIGAYILNIKTARYRTVLRTTHWFANMSKLGKFATAWEKFRYSQSKLGDICAVYGRTSSKTVDSRVETELSDKRRLKGTQAWNFFKYFFCRNRNHMVPRACNTRFLKIIFDSAEIIDFETFLRMLSMLWNRFQVCSACN